MTNNKPFVKNLNEEDDFIQTIELELEDGTFEECEVLDILEIDGKSYVALLPLDGNEYYVYECKGLDEENIEIVTIEDDEEHEKIISAFENYFNDDDDDDDDYYDEIGYDEDDDIEDDEEDDEDDDDDDDDDDDE